MGDLYFGQLGVIGATVAGGYAELLPRAVDPRATPSPGGVSWHQAVAFPPTWLTAHHALFDTGHLSFGETVLDPPAGAAACRRRPSSSRRARRRHGAGHRGHRGEVRARR